MGGGWGEEGDVQSCRNMRGKPRPHASQLFRRLCEDTVAAEKAGSLHGDKANERLHVSQFLSKCPWVPVIHRPKTGVGACMKPFVRITHVNHQEMGEWALTQRWALARYIHQEYTVSFPHHRRKGGLHVSKLAVNYEQLSITCI